VKKTLYLLLLLAVSSVYAGECSRGGCSNDRDSLSCDRAGGDYRGQSGDKCICWSDANSHFDTICFGDNGDRLCFVSCTGGSRQHSYREHNPGSVGASVFSDQKNNHTAIQRAYAMRQMCQLLPEGPQISLGGVTYTPGLIFTALRGINDLNDGMPNIVTQLLDRGLGNDAMRFVTLAELIKGECVCPTANHICMANGTGTWCRRADVTALSRVLGAHMAQVERDAAAMPGAF
jgi:hypothetical protein